MTNAHTVFERNHQKSTLKPKKGNRVGKKNYEVVKFFTLLLTALSPAIVYAQGEMQLMTEKINRQFEQRQPTTEIRHVEELDTTNRLASYGLLHPFTATEIIDPDQKNELGTAGRKYKVQLDSLFLALVKDKLADVIKQDSVFGNQTQQIQSDIKARYDEASYKDFSQDTNLFKKYLQKLQKEEEGKLATLNDLKYRMTKTIDELKDVIRRYELDIDRKKDKKYEASFDNNAAQKLLNEIGGIITSFNKIITEINEGRSALKGDFESRKKAAEEKKGKSEDTKTQLTNLLSAIVPLTSTQVIPNIDVKASAIKRTNYEKGRFTEYSAQLFLGLATPTFADTEKVDLVYKKISRNLLYPEASNFGIRVNIVGNILSQVANHSETLTGYLLQFNFLSKNTPIIDSGKISGSQYINVIHLRGGLNQVFFDNRLGLYGNVNFLVPIDKRVEFRNYFNSTDRDQWWFFNLGMNLNLNIDKSDNILQLALDFIVNTPSMQTITRNDDIAIPSLKLTFIPNYNFK